MLNFYPKWTIEDGVKQIIKAFNEGKVTDYRKAKYSNYKFMLEENGTNLNKLVYHYDEESKLSELTEK